MVMSGSAQPETRTISAAEFKAKCLQLMDEVNENKQPITVTKRGRAVGLFVPIASNQKPFRSIFGRTVDTRVPSETKWRKLKDEWSDDWDKSTHRLARQLNESKK